MKRGILGLLTAVLLVGLGTAQAYIETDLITDGGFDTFAAGSSNPDEGTSPWDSTETGTDAGMRMNAENHISLPNAIQWQYYAATSATFQNLGVTVQSGKDYEVSLWHAIGDPHSTYTNDTMFEVSIWTSATVDGTYTEAVAKTNASTGAEDTMYNYTSTFTAAELSGVVGQYMQLRVGKILSGANAQYKLWIDDVKFGPTGTLPAEHSTLASFDTTFTSPDFIVEGLTATFAGGNGVKSDHQSTDGTFGTIVNPAADVQPASALSLVTATESKRTVTLTLENTSSTDIYLDDLHFDYGRASDSAPDAVTVSSSGDISAGTLTNITGISNSELQGDADDFDLDLTGLADSTLEPGEQAVITFYLEGAAGSYIGTFLDNVLVGGSVYTPPLHPTLATFDTTFTSADYAVSDLTGTWTGDKVPLADANSTDGTFGTILNPSAEAVTLGAVTVDSGKPVATLTLNNTGTKEMYLDDISFDVGRFFAGAPSNFVLTTSGDITAATLTNGIGITVIGKVGDADDYDVDLTGLADNVLEAGGEAVFTFTFSGAADLASSLIDNVLVGGTVGATLQLNPAGIDMAFTDATSISTNELEVSYLEGNPPTNVNVSSVSVINDASGGFSVTPTAFVLNDPTPSNQVVEVIFNNNTAQLDPNEVATADVQIIWNELGSAVVSTSTVPVSATRLGFSEENVVAAFHSTVAWRKDSSGGGNADIAINGVDAVVSGIQYGNGGDGSTDTSYGTLLGNAPTNGGVGQMSVNYNGGHIYIAVTNNTQSEVELDSLHFDVATKWGGSSNDTITVTLNGDLGNDIVLVTVSNLLNSSGGLVDYDDYDVDLTGLADNTLADGEGIVLTFTYAGTDIGMLDNVALLGTGIAPAVMSRVGGSTATLGVSGLDLSVSQDVDLLYVVGDLETNVVVTGVSFANEDVPGAFSAVGAFPVELLTPEVTNSAVFSLEFDNTVANLPAGTEAYAEVIVEFDEPGGGSRTYSFDAVAVRPADAPSGVIALFDTEFLVPDSAYNGVLGWWAEGVGLEGSLNKGSDDGTYGSLATPAAPVNNDTWKFRGTDPVTTLTITNKTVADIDLSMLHFDIGVWYAGVNDFTVSVSGDVTASNLLTSGITELGDDNNDYDDHDIDLSVLPDHTLGGGESVTFTFELEPVDPGAEYNGVWIDNIALMGTSAGGADPIGDITLGGLVDGDLVFSWDTSVGQTYNILTNADLTVPSGWGILGTIVGDGSPVSVTNTPDQAQLFYKVSTP